MCVYMYLHTCMWREWSQACNVADNPKAMYSELLKFKAQWVQCLSGNWFFKFFLFNFHVLTYLHMRMDLVCLYCLYVALHISLAANNLCICFDITAGYGIYKHAYIHMYIYVCVHLYTIHADIRERPPLLSYALSMEHNLIYSISLFLTVLILQCQWLFLRLNFFFLIFWFFVIGIIKMHVCTWNESEIYFWSPHLKMGFLALGVFVYNLFRPLLPTKHIQMYAHVHTHTHSRSTSHFSISNLGVVIFLRIWFWKN